MSELLKESNFSSQYFRDAMKSQDSDRPVKVATLFHAAPLSRVQSILENGLEPRSENSQDKYPDRIYLTTSESASVRISFQLRKALIHNKVKKSTWKESYAILKIDTSKLPNDFVFYVDGYFPQGVYTDKPIPPNAISVVGTINSELLLSKNWPKFWDRYFWEHEPLK